jgi:phytanoyl-CoA hydroxylase
VALSNNPEFLKQEFDRCGYVVIPGFLSLDEVCELRRETERYILEVVPNTPGNDVYFEVKGQKDTLKQLVRMSQYDRYFEKLLESDRFTKLADLLLGKAVGKNVLWFNKPDGVSLPTPPHQDGYYFMLEPNAALTMWLALDSVNELSGCVRYVSGSQLNGLRPHESTTTLGFSQSIRDYGVADAQNEVAISAEPGDLLVHHSLTIHRADANRSSSARRALALIYYSRSAKEDVERLREYTASLEARIAAQGKI